MTKGVINGSRPLPLKINKDSHTIQKPLSEPPKTAAAAAAKRQPVIIYTHSPKVIKTQASEFMALVQRLTGLTRDDDTEKTVKSEKEEESENEKQYLENETVTSAMADPRFDPVKQEYDSPMYSQYFGNSNEMYCSAGSNRLFPSSNPYSPSYMDFTKAYTDY